MANTIKIKRSAVQGKVPLTTDLALGELAINTYDGKLYTKKDVGGTVSVVEIGGGANFSTDVSLQNQSATKYYETSTNGNNYVAIRAPSSLSADITLTLPTTDGDPDQVLATDGNGNLSWVTRLGGSGTTGDFLSSSTASEQSGYFGNVYLKDDANTSHYLEITNSADLTALRTLSVNVNDANRMVSLSGNLTVSAAATISGTNTGDQTITLTGDVTGSGTGSFAATIANSAVTYAKIQNVSSTDKLLGRSSAGAGVVEELSTIPANILGNSSLFVGTTSIALNRASVALALTGITSIDGSAATLTTSRTLWGQSFNGSADVSGSLTSVGDITGTGAVALTATGGTLGLVATGANVVQVSTNGTERARIDSNGCLLVGTSSVVLGTPKTIIENSSSNIDILRVQCGASEVAGNIVGLAFGHGLSGARPKASIGLVATGSYGKGDLTFYVDSVDDNDSVSSSDEKFRISSLGAWGLSGANYGTSGQVLTSNGSSTAPTWQSAAGGGDPIETMLFC